MSRPNMAILNTADVRAQALEHLRKLFTVAKRRNDAESAEELVHAADAFVAVRLITAEEGKMLTDLDHEDEPQFVRTWYGWDWREAA